MKQGSLGEVRFKSSLNKFVNERHKDTIRAENMQLMRKLTHATSQYSRDKILKQTAKAARYGQSISKSRGWFEGGMDHRGFKTAATRTRTIKSMRPYSSDMYGSAREEN
jgi:hypothetical protein